MALSFEERERIAASVLAGERTASQAARDIGLTRQAVSKWVERLQKEGTLKPEGRGRPKTPVLTLEQKLAIRAGMVEHYKKEGLPFSSYLPRATRPPISVLQHVMSTLLNRTITEAFAKRTAAHLEIPYHNDPVPGVPETLDYADEFTQFDKDWTPPTPPSPLTEPIPSKPSKPRRRGRPPKKDLSQEPAPLGPLETFVDFDDDDDDLPKTKEEYDAWVKETKTLLAKRSQYAGLGQMPAAGVRIGKHAKAKAKQNKKKKRRNNLR